MVKLPNDVILNFISKEFCICWFKDLNHNPEAPPHFYVNIPIKKKYCLLLCIITKQLSKRIKYYSNKPTAIAALVKISNSDLHILNKKFDSCIDCNSAELFTIVELIDRIDPRYDIEIKMNNNEIPDELKSKIVNAINISPLVRRYIKDLIK